MRRADTASDPVGLGAPGLNLTPLLDVIFILVFFFLLATQVRERQRLLEMQLPSSEMASTAEPDPTIPQITLVPGGGLLLDGEAIDEEALEAELRRRVLEDGATSAILASDGTEPFQRVVDVSDLCRRAGLVELAPRVQPPAN